MSGNDQNGKDPHTSGCDTTAYTPSYSPKKAGKGTCDKYIYDSLGRIIGYLETRYSSKKSSGKYTCGTVWARLTSEYPCITTYENDPTGMTHPLAGCGRATITRKSDMPAPIPPRYSYSADIKEKGTKVWTPMIYDVGYVAQTSGYVYDLQGFKSDPVILGWW